MSTAILYDLPPSYCEKRVGVQGRKKPEKAINQPRTHDYVFYESPIKGKFSTLGNFHAIFGEPLLKNSTKGVVEYMSDEQKRYELNKAEMLNALKSSQRVRFQTVEEMINYIKGCEKLYRRSTVDHLKHFEARGFEGNADDARWYRFAKNLLESGYDLSEILGS